MSDPSRLDPHEQLAERQSAEAGQRRPWRPAADIASEIVRLRPYLTGLADELRSRLTDKPDDPPR